MRQLSHPSVGAGTGGGPACVLVAAWASTGAWTAGGAAGTRYRTSRVLCRLPPVPAPSQLPASHPVKCEISVKSKHFPSSGGRHKTIREGVPHPIGSYHHPHPTYSPASSPPLKQHPKFPRSYPGQGGPCDKHRFVLINPMNSSSPTCVFILLNI